jgi:hypothetical protein
MDRQGAGDVFAEVASSRGGPRIATGLSGIRKFAVAGFAGFGFGIRKIVAGFAGFGIGMPESSESSAHARMRCAQRRAMAVMVSYMWRKARLRAAHAKELVASLI